MRVVVVTVMCGEPHWHGCFELWKESEESESGRDVVCWRGGVHGEQASAADVMLQGAQGRNAVCEGGVFAESTASGIPLLPGPVPPSFPRLGTAAYRTCSLRAIQQLVTSTTSYNTVCFNNTCLRFQVMALTTQMAG